MLSAPIHEAPTDSTFVCDCEWWMRHACEREPFYKEHKGKRYCVLHFPGKNKSQVFNEVIKRKFEVKDFDFSGVYFPDGLTICNSRFNEQVIFHRAKFGGPV